MVPGTPAQLGHAPTGAGRLVSCRGCVHQEWTQAGLNNCPLEDWKADVRWPWHVTTGPPEQYTMPLVKQTMLAPCILSLNSWTSRTGSELLNHGSGWFWRILLKPEPRNEPARTVVQQFGDSAGPS